MRQLVADWVTGVESSDFIAIVDDEGEHSARWVLDQARALVPLFHGEDGPRTVLLQADNSWRTMAAAVAAGLADAVLGLVSRHSTEAEIRYAFDDIRPDAVLADAEAWPEWDLAGLLGAAG